MGMPANGFDSILRGASSAPTAAETEDDQAWAVFKAARAAAQVEEARLQELRDKADEARADDAGAAEESLQEAAVQQEALRRLATECGNVAAQLQGLEGAQVNDDEVSALTRRQNVLKQQLDYIRRAQAALRLGDELHAATLRISAAAPEHFAAVLAKYGELAALRDALDPAVEGSLQGCLSSRMEACHAELHTALTRAFAAAFARIDPLRRAPGALGGHSGSSSDDGGSRGSSSVSNKDPAAARAVELATRALLNLQLELPFSRSSGSGGESASLWALDAYLEPVALRFRYHFDGGRPSDRDDRPEWPMSFLLSALRSYAPLLRQLAQPALNDCEAASIGSCDGSVGLRAQLDAVAYFSRGLTMLACARLRRALPHALAGPGTAPLLRLADEALSFDKAVSLETGRRYGGDGGGSGQEGVWRRLRWPSAVGVLTAPPQRLSLWLEAEREQTVARLGESLSAPGAWRPPSSPAEDAVASLAVERATAAAAAPAKPAAAADLPGALQPKRLAPACARDLTVLLQAVTERSAALKEPAKRLRYVDAVQRPLLQRFYGAVYDFGRSQDVTNGLFRRNSSANSSSGRGSAPLWVAPWVDFCWALNACDYVTCALRDAEDDVSNAALQAAAITHQQQEQQRQRGAQSSLPAAAATAAAAAAPSSNSGSTAVPSGGGLAVVVNGGSGGGDGGIGGGSSIIGPSRAIHAAFGSIKGVAGIVRRNRADRSPARGAGNSDETAAAAAAAAVTGSSNQETVGEALAAAAATGPSTLLATGPATATDLVAPAAMAAAAVVAGAAAAAPGLYAEELSQYSELLAAMVHDAAAAVADGLLAALKPYLRAPDVFGGADSSSDSVPAAATAAAAAAAAATAAVTSELLAQVLLLLDGSLATAAWALPPAHYAAVWRAAGATLRDALTAKLLRQAASWRGGGRGGSDGASAAAAQQQLADADVLLAALAEHAPSASTASPLRAYRERAALAALPAARLTSLRQAMAALGLGSGAEGAEGGPEALQLADMLEGVGVSGLTPAHAWQVVEAAAPPTAAEALGRLA